MMRVMARKRCLPILVLSFLILADLPWLRAAEDAAGSASAWARSSAIVAPRQVIDVGRSKPAPADPLAWDSLYKEFVAKTNELDSLLEFNVTNVSSSEILISALRPSCGCTVAQMPNTPWRLQPGDHGAITVSTDLRNKRGVLNKVVVVTTSAGLRVLQMKLTIPYEPQQLSAVQNRGQNMLVALADQQAIFHGDCATCHTAPAVGKSAAPLYEAACGICHDAERRASIVPALDSSRADSSSNYWYRWTAFGKTNSLMPGFAASRGGPLTDAQIDSLVQYLARGSRARAE